MLFRREYFVFILHVCVTNVFCGPYSRLKEHIGVNSHRKVYGQTCGSDDLTCVLPKDCDHKCPPLFESSLDNGACYFISSAHSVAARTFVEAQDYCSKISDGLLWIESAKELKSLREVFQGSTLPITTLINAEYSREHRTWIWAGTHEKIEWKLLFRDLLTFDEVETIVEGARLSDCFSVTFEESSTTFSTADCNGQSDYMCKLGEYKGSCGRTSQTTCCYSPTFDYYIKTKDVVNDAGIQVGPGGCNFNIGGEKQSCDQVLAEVSTISSPRRVGTSYFYLSETPCLVREAVISSEAVHKYVVRLLSTHESLFEDNSAKIGLTYNERERTGHWSNGKREDYYQTYWFSEQPRRGPELDGGCAAYTQLPGFSDFRWRLFPKEDCQQFLSVCELPLFRSSTNRSIKKETCGVRRERGVLAKAFYSTYDTSEASFGEFPWHAAISFFGSGTLGAHEIHACSGVLVHEKFVLTSAHCVSSVRHSNIQVTLGLHDLKNDDAILEPIRFKVEEIIIHPGYGELHTYNNDLALLQLETKVNVAEYPHIGLGCLPDPQIVKSHGGKWECYSVGWPDKGYGYRRVLERVDVEFTSEGFCHRLNADYYRRLRYGQTTSRFNTYRGQSNRGNLYRNDEPDLLCTVPTGESQCSGDETSILVCKKESIYIDKPFFAPPGSSSFESSLNSKVKDTRKQLHHSGDGYESQAPREVEYIVNSYGKNRFDTDQFFVLGIGSGLSRCGEAEENGGYHNSFNNRRKTLSSRFAEVWSSVYDYLPFIHRIVDLYEN